MSRKLSDYTALAVSTLGVGYLPFAPGTYGSIIGVVVYLGYAAFLGRAKFYLIDQEWVHQQYSAFFYSATSVLLIFFFFLGIWASTKAAKLFKDEDSQKIVIDEVLGQLVVFTFIPFGVTNWLVFMGFLFFRMFDIWKPYPVKVFERLPSGIGICADDIVAGAYSGVCLGIVYWFSLNF